MDDFSGSVALLVSDNQQRALAEAEARGYARAQAEGEAIARHREAWAETVARIRALLKPRLAEAERGGEVKPITIVYLATVRAVSPVDITLEVIPASDGEEPIVRDDDKLRVNVPGAANAEDVGDVLRAFGSIIEVSGAARITIEPVAK